MEDIMLKIIGFDFDIIELTITKKFNWHSVCYFRLNINDTPKEYFEDKLGQKLIVEDGECLFYGEITDISTISFFTHTEIAIKAFSSSLHLDIKPQKRIFQNPDKTINSITNYIKRDGRFEVICKIDEKLVSPILQCEETDFEFIIRMAHACGKQVLINDNQKLATPELVIMNFSSEPLVEIDQEPEQFPCHTTYLSSPDGKRDRIEIIEVTLKELYINLGQQVRINGKILYAAEVNIFLEKGILKCRYLFYQLNKMPLWDCPSLPEYVSLKAITEDNNDIESKGRIKVRFTCDYIDAEPDKQMWIPYKTPYIAKDGGFIFLPDKNDTVEIIYNNGKIFACQYLDEIPLKDDFRDVKNKYIANIFGKQICFKENQLEINSNGNTLILSEECIEINVKDTKISVDKDKIALKVAKNEICINENTIIKSRKLGIQADNIQIEANKEVCIHGKEIHLN